MEIGESAHMRIGGLVINGRQLDASCLGGHDCRSQGSLVVERQNKPDSF